jgi:hypothetical protein
MMLQEEINFTEYFRCYCLGTDNVHIMQYEPRNPHHLRYVRNAPPVAKALLDKVREGVIKLNKGLGYDFNTVEFAIRDGIPYAIDFCNPAPDADVHSVGQENFDWIVENAAELAIKKAKAHKPGQLNLTWGTFVSQQFPGNTLKATPKTPAKKASAKVAVAPKAAVSKPVAKAETAKPAKSAVKATSGIKAKPTSAPKIAGVEKPAAPKPAVSKPSKAPKATEVKAAAPKKTVAPKKAATPKKVATPKAAASKKPAAPKKTATPKATAAKGTAVKKVATPKKPGAPKAAAKKAVAPKQAGNAKPAAPDNKESKS